MRPGTVTIRFDWQGIPLSVDYTPDWSRAMSSVYGYTLAHLGISSADRRPLPITETGYRSEFVATSTVDAAGGPEAFVRTYLDDFADEPAWLDYLDRSAQLTLF